MHDHDDEQDDDSDSREDAEYLPWGDLKPPAMRVETHSGSLSLGPHDGKAAEPICSDAGRYVMMVTAARTPTTSVSAVMTSESH